jgi:hypothetical protein
MKTLAWMLKHSRDIIIVILAVILILQRECAPKPKPCPEYHDSTSVTVTHDTVTVAGKTVYYPVPYEVHTIDTFFATKPADTAFILRDYVELRKYNIPIIDTNGKINLFASVQFNRIIQYSHIGEFYPKTVYVYKEHTETVQPRNKVYAGIGVGGWIDKFGAEASFGLNTKKDHLYTISYDPINTYARLNLYWKIKLKR